MRQIELYRRDPSLGLVPPPGPAWTFVKWHYPMMIIVGVNVAALTIVLQQTGPVTRWTVLDISQHVGLILLALAGSLVVELFRRTFSIK